MTKPLTLTDAAFHDTVQHGEPVQRLVGVQQRELLEGLIEGALSAWAARH